MNLLNLIDICPEYPGFLPDGGEAWKAWDWHVLALCIPGFILCIFFFGLGIKLRNNKKAADATMFLLGLVLALAELYKQICFNKMRGFSFGEGYAWQIFPWQLCSVPMFISLVMPFVKNKNRRDVLIAFMAVFGMIGGFAALFINQQNLFTWKDVGIYVHTILWHLILMMLGFFSIGYLSIGKGSYRRNVRVWAYTYLMLIIFSGIAQAINFIIPTVLGVDSCQAIYTNMWYISMYYDSTVMILTGIWNLSPGIGGWGWILAYALYLIALGLADYIVINIYFGIYKLFARLNFKYRVKYLEMGKNI